MVYSRRYRRKRLLIVLACILAAVLILGSCFFLFLHRPMSKKLASAAVPNEPLFAVRFGSAPSFADAAPEELDEYFFNAVSFAKKNGMNAVFFDVLNSADGVGFRDRSFETWRGAASQDTLFKKYDPLHSLCEIASDSGISVYAVVPKISGDKDWDRSLKRLKRHYAVAGLYTESDILFDSDTQKNAAFIGESDFAQPEKLFRQTLGGQMPDAVFDYETCLEKPEELSVLASTLDSSVERPALLNFVPPAKLSVEYPADGAKIFTETCFVMGTSDPAMPLFLNGAEVENRAPAGTYGVLVTLSYGENVLTVSQGNEELRLTVTRPEPPAPKPESENKDKDTEMPHDDTVRAEAGTPVQINGWITSLLYDPASDANINETVRHGAVVRVTDSVETVRKGKKTWAYQIASGDYVLAYNTTVLSDPAKADFSFTGASAQKTDYGEAVTFAEKGTPLAYTNMVDGDLVMDFYDAAFSPDFNVSDSEMIEQVIVEPHDSFTRVTFTFTKPVWGHTVEYTEDGATQILLKKQPVRSDIFGKPLTGVTVLLDAGHGDHDTGAVGPAGLNAPTEKDANLALMLAAKYRLEQMGATVQTIRTDDSFLSLEERNRAIITKQPDFFISLHHNSIDLRVDANNACGTECYYFYPAGKELANTLVENVTAATDRASRGAHWGYYYVTRSTVCPSVLLETGFMVNPAEYEQVTNDAQLLAAGDAIARSILACVPHA